MLYFQVKLIRVLNQLNLVSSAKEIKMKTAYDIRQKFLLMAIALGISLLLLGLDVCQKRQTGMGNVTVNATGPKT